MTVYIEYVIIDNLIIDYMILKATFALTGKTVTRGRLFLCAFLGAMVALIYPLIGLSGIILTAIKILSGLLIVLCAGRFKDFREYYISVSVFFLYTFITGGAVIGLFNLFNLNYSEEVSVALMALPVGIVINALSAVIRFIYRRKEVRALIYKVSLTLNGKTVFASGFMDTGNALYDGDRIVIVCNKRFFTEFIGDGVLKVKLKKIKVGTVNGDKLNFAVDLDVFKIYIKDEPNIFNKVTLCATEGSVGEGYDLILHPALLEKSYAEKIVEQSKEVS